MAFVTKLHTPLRIALVRPCLCALALFGTVLLGGCEEVEIGGVGASAGLPTAFTGGATDTADTGVGNVHWVGNPRW
jgi:hypothetical protein